MQLHFDHAIIIFVYNSSCCFPPCILHVISLSQHDDLDLSQDAGVSRAMATVFSLPRRIPYLLTHGMVHLTGHDHETDEEWRLMTQREDEVLRELALEFPQCVQPLLVDQAQAST